MTNNNHLITPPPELVQEWINKHYGCKVDREIGGVERAIAIQSACWAADQELEACCEWLDQNTGRWDLLAELRAARRPKPSLKERIATAIAHGDTSIALALLDQALPS